MKTSKHRNQHRNARAKHDVKKQTMSINQHMLGNASGNFIQSLKPLMCERKLAALLRGKHPDDAPVVWHTLSALAVAAQFVPVTWFHRQDPPNSCKILMCDMGRGWSR